MDDDIYEYRIKSYEDECPPIKVASGPNGWYHVITCTLSPDRKEFSARVIGWTLPQVFKAMLTVERKVK